MTNAFRHVHRISRFVGQYMILQSDCPPLPSDCPHSALTRVDCPWVALFTGISKFLFAFIIIVISQLSFWNFQKYFVRFQSHRLSIQCIALGLPFHKILFAFIVNVQTKK